MDQPTNRVVFYILMRTGLDSMNPGKAVAQGSHAMSQCLRKAYRDPEAQALVERWVSEDADDYGTAVTLSVTDREMRHVIERAIRFKLHAGIVHDPSYPVADGEMTHEVAIDTCGWLLVESSVAVQYIGTLPWMA